jgi:hypothetical protein
VIGVDHKTWIGIWEHTAPASFTVLAMLARIAAVVGVSPHNVTNIPLPDVAPQMVVDDLSKLRTISVRNPWIVQWCDLRLQQIQTTPSADEDTPWFLARAINVGFVQMQAQLNANSRRRSSSSSASIASFSRRCHSMPDLADRKRPSYRSYAGSHRLNVLRQPTAFASTRSLPYASAYIFARSFDSNHTPSPVT